MPVSIEIYEKSGVNGDVELTTNANWKSISAVDSIYKYFIYPVRNDIQYLNCYQKVLYGKISGEYNTLRRIRWEFSTKGIEGTGDWSVWYGMSNTYPEPTIEFDGFVRSMSPLSRTVLAPNLSLVSPETAFARVPQPIANRTYFTDYLILRLFAPVYKSEVGNWTPGKGFFDTGEGEAGSFEFEDPWTISLIADEFE